MKYMILIGFLIMAALSSASTEKANPTLGDRTAPEPNSQRVMPPAYVSRESFYASTKAKLEEADMRLDNLRLDGPDRVGPQLAKIDDELQGLHDVLNNLTAVRDRDLRSLEKKVASNFKNLEKRLSKIEDEVK